MTLSPGRYVYIHKLHLDDVVKRKQVAELQLAITKVVLKVEPGPRAGRYHSPPASFGIEVSGSPKERTVGSTHRPAFVLCRRSKSSWWALACRSHATDDHVKHERQGDRASRTYKFDYPKRSFDDPVVVLWDLQVDSHCEDGKRAIKRPSRLDGLAWKHLQKVLGLIHFGGPPPRGEGRLPHDDRSS